MSATAAIFSIASSPTQSSVSATRKTTFRNTAGLEHFDAVKVGLTATPALHTVSIFGDPIYKYSYREAVVDGYLIDHEPPLQITTALSQAGIKFKKGEELQIIDTRTGKVDLTHAPDEIKFDVEEFNKAVI